MEKQINLIELLRLYLRRWWVLLLGVLAGALAAAVITEFFITPMYVSASSLYIMNTDETTASAETDVNLSTIMVRKELVQTYAELLTSNVFLKKVVAESGLDYTHEELLGMLSMTSKNNTEILVVGVESENPQHAYILAQVIANLADEQVSSVVNGGSVKILDEPEYPEACSTPNVANNIKIGMLAGLILSMVTVFLVYVLDKKIKSSEQLAQMFNIPVLGEIPYFADNGKMGRLPNFKRAL